MTDKKKSQKVQEDEFTPKIPNQYKKKCDINGVTVCKQIKDRLDNAIESGKLQTLQLWEQIGPIQIRSLMDTLCDLQYPYLKKVRLWKIDLQDEGTRSICNYIDKTNSIQYLDLMDNKITALGCEFLGRTLGKSTSNIKKFRIDNNPIGNEGLANLTVGLRQNDKIQKLSFNYCMITEEGVKYIQQIMANINCRLRTLKLQGNPLKNNGTFEVLRAIKSCGDHLQKLNLCDVQMNILNYKVDMGQSIQQKIANQLVSILENNNSIAKYNFKNNWIPDEVAKHMLDVVKQNKTIFIIQFPQCIAHPLKEMHNQIMKKRKPKKKKTKGKKKSSK